MMRIRKIYSKVVKSVLLIALFSLSDLLWSASLPNIIKQIKPAIVGVGTFQKTRRPPSKLMGTGFFVADGYHVITNHHVISNTINHNKKERLVIFYSKNNLTQYRNVRVLDTDETHDLALLRIEGRKFPVLEIESQRNAEEGEQVAFTGFPIGAVLGLYPATHRGIISAVTPVAIPAPSSSSLDAAMIKRLKKPYQVYQLDATAYPGNSGSPIYSPEDGKVLGVINSVFVKESKESVLQKPSGITYAIPAKYILKLLRKNNIEISSERIILGY